MVLELQAPDSTAARDHVRLLGVTLRPTSAYRHARLHCQCIKLLLHGYVTFGVLGVQLTRNRRPHSFTRIRGVTRWLLQHSPVSWRARRKWLRTSCNECWTPRLVGATHMFDWGLSSELLYTELHWLDVPERVTYISSASRCSAAYMAKHPITWSISVNRFQASHHGNISNPRADDSWSYLAAATQHVFLCSRPASAEFAAGQFERPGLLTDIAFGVRWRRFSLRHTNTCNALSVLQQCDLLFTFLLLHRSLL